MLNDTKRAAQEALFTAIQDQAENILKATMRPAEKAQLLRELAEAYCLTAGGQVSSSEQRRKHPENGASPR